MRLSLRTFYSKGKCNVFINRHVHFCKYSEKGTRYQIDVRGNSSFFSLQVNENTVVHADSRTDQFYKYFSAFAESDSGITFCIISFSDAILAQIQFYHGFYLQDSQQSKGANQFLVMTRRIQQISNMIKMNYNKYKSQVMQREPINDRIQIYATFAIIVFLLIVVVVKVVYFNKAVRFMKNRKII